MRICVFTYEFLPVVGGVQVVSAMLAAAWKAAGHEVVMVTRTPPDPDPDYDRRLPYPVVRLSPDKPQAKRRWKPILDQTDLIVCHNVSLTYWPIWFLRRKKIVFVHHLFLGQEPTREQPVRERIRSGASPLDARSDHPPRGGECVYHRLHPAMCRLSRRRGH